MVALTSQHTSVGALCTAVLILATACGKNRTPELVQPVGETHTTASSTGGARPQGHDVPAATVGVVIAPEVRRACDLPADPREAPKFDVDAARLRPRGDDVLRRVASCLVSHRLGDARLTIVGHTDPRGSTEYNEQLGHYRAVAAKQHLVELGVPASKLVVESRGERDARGSDEPSWALDRKIEIRVDAPLAPVEQGEK